MMTGAAAGSTAASVATAAAAGNCHVHVLSASSGKFMKECHPSLYILVCIS